MKLLHTADWHIGRRFPSFDENDRLRLMRARIDVIERIFGVAERHQVDAVLCAGDLFDDPHPRREHYIALADVLARRSLGRPVYLLPGNHDPLIAGSVWSNDHEFRRLIPKNVQVVDEEEMEFSLGEGAVLFARPCTSKAGQRDNAMRLPPRKAGDDRIRVGMVHGSTFDAGEGWEQNFPIAKDAAVQRGLDYLAIGDTHAFRLVPEDAPVPTVYPSAPEATNFGETDTGYVSLVFFTRRTRRALVRKEKVAKWTWRQERITEIQQLRDLAASDLAQTVMRLELDLAVSPNEFEEVEALLQLLKGSEATHGRVGVLQLRRDALALRTDDIERYFDDLPDVLKQTAKRLRAIEAEGERSAEAQRALFHLYRLTREFVS
ncbi:MAG: DNA repair exonuclease [Myxococcota bacterium]